MAQVENIERLMAKLGRLAQAAENEKKVSVVVGYTQRYAVYVHEVQAEHKEGKQWKYLEAPARRLAKTIGEDIRKVVQKTKSLKQGLLIGGLRLQRESQKIVPIDTSALKASAFTCLEEYLEQTASTAYAKSEAIRQGELAKRKKRK